MGIIGSFEIAVRNMLKRAKLVGLKQTRKEWASAPAVWDEVERRLGK